LERADCGTSQIIPTPDHFRLLLDISFRYVSSV
jgi:hypothetical protein